MKSIKHKIITGLVFINTILMTSYYLKNRHKIHKNKPIDSTSYLWTVIQSSIINE